MYQVILKASGLEITIDSEDDLKLTLDLIKDLLGVLKSEKHSIRVSPIIQHRDYRVQKEPSRETSQADALEATLRKIGRPASPKEIADVATRSGLFQTNAKNPSDLIRQVLRKYPRFTQLNRSLWTLASGFGEADEPGSAVWGTQEDPVLNFSEFSREDLRPDF